MALLVLRKLLPLMQVHSAGEECPDQQRLQFFPRSLLRCTNGLVELTCGCIFGKLHHESNGVELSLGRVYATDHGWIGLPGARRNERAP